MIPRFPPAERALFEQLQKQIKPALLDKPPVVAIWALLDLVYYLARLPRMQLNRAQMAQALRAIADMVEQP